MRRSVIDYHVLDAVMMGADLYADMVTYLNSADSLWRIDHDRPLQSAEVFAALHRLVRDGLVEVQLLDQVENDFVSCGEGVWPTNDLAEMFFEVTGRGRVVFLNWEA